MHTGMVKRELEEQMYRDTITQREIIIAIQQYIENKESMTLMDTYLDL